MNNYQKITAELAETCGTSTDILARYADVASELGELGKELLQGTNYGIAKFEHTAGLAIELGDVIAALALLANAAGLDMDECFNLAMQKYRRRFEAIGQIGS